MTTTPVRRLRHLALKGVAGVDRPANHTQVGADGWLVLKADGTPEEGTTVTQTDTPVAEQLAKATEQLEAANARIAELEQAAAAPAPAVKADDADVDPLIKALEGLDPAVRKAWEARDAELAEVRKAAETERNARLEREYVAKAAEYSALPTTPEVFGPVLRAVDEHAPDVAETLTTVLRAVDAQLREAGLFKAVGHNATGGASALDQLKAAAAEIRKADSTISEAQALRKARAEHPDLVAAYQKERG